MDTYFDAHFTESRNEFGRVHLANIRRLWTSAISGIERAFNRCRQDKRKRRAWDPCTDWLSNEPNEDNTWRDTNLAVMQLGWFVREEIFKSTSRPRCEFHGRRIVSKQAKRFFLTTGSLHKSLIMTLYQY